MTTVTPRARTYKHTRSSRENLLFFNLKLGMASCQASIHETRWQPLCPINIPGAFCVLYFQSLSGKIAGFFARGVLLVKSTIGALVIPVQYRYRTLSHSQGKSHQGYSHSQVDVNRTIFLTSCSLRLK